jgi:hypothetical protein
MRFPSFVFPCLLFLSAKAIAGPPPAAPLGKQLPATIKCVHYTEKRYKLPKNLLWAIKEAEGAGPGVISDNPRENTKNLGSFQHDTNTLPDVAKYGVTGKALLYSECAAAYTAGWKLRKSYDKFKSWMLATAAYNCGNNCVNKALNKNPGYQSINDLSLPDLTKNVYVPHVQTALLRFASNGEPGVRLE